MNTTSSSLAPDILHSTNAVLNDHLTTQKSINTPIQWYIKSLTRISEIFSTELAIISHECNVIKDVLQTRKQHKTGKQAILENEISLSQLELHQKIIDIENSKQKKCVKKSKQSMKKNDIASQNTSEDGEEQVLLSEIEVMGI